MNEIGNRSELQPKHMGSFPQAGEGIPQGAILSPMLANFYLSTFDEEMCSQGFEVIRYADDFVVMCETRKKAEAAYNAAKDFLSNHLRLQMHELGTPKTRVVEYQGGFTFLGYEVRDGRHYPSPASIKKLLEKVDKAFEDPKGKPLLPVIIRIASVLSGWKEAYKGSDLLDAASRINTQVANCTTAFLRVNGFTQDGRTVTHKQLCILGIPTI